MEYEKCLISRLPEDVQREVFLGNFSVAEKLIDKYLEMNIPELLRNRLLYEKERMKRLRKDFPYTRKEALALLRENIAGFRDEELDALIEHGFVDRMYMDGEERFYSRFIHNLFFLNPEMERRRIRRDEERENIRKIVNSAIDRILKERKGRKYKVRAGIKLKIKAYDDRPFRVWLPFPKEIYPLSNVRLVEAIPENFEISDNSTEQRTIFFESESREYLVEFEYIVAERYTEVDIGKIDEDISGMDKYLSEKPPHILFTPYLRRLAENIAGEERNPYLRAKRIYDWITRNIRYSYVREYSTYENIPEFVATSLRGDCGMQALLFITLCRILGIPARWQSGWFVSPIKASPHDWAEFYISPYGWLPADLSFGGARRNTEKYRAFYFGNLDAYRMIANTDIQGNFIPTKKYLRSDPVDNQRGEAETEDRNIYYDEMEYEMFVKKFEEL